MHAKNAGKYLVTGITLSVLLAGCAATMPKVAFHEHVPVTSPVTGKTVALETSLAGDQFNDPECLTALTRQCRNVTLSRKKTLTDYNQILRQALREEGAKTVPGPQADYVIHSHLTPLSPHRYMMMIDYDLGHTLAMGLIPLVGAFTPRYYTLKDHMVDHITVTIGQKTVLNRHFVMHVKKQVAGGGSTESNLSMAKAEKMYISNQDQSIGKLLTDLSQSVRAPQESPKKQDGRMG